MSDPYYDKVSLLLPMFGANNGTTFTDYSPTPKTITRYGDTKTVTAQSKYYGSSGYFDGVYTTNGEHLTVPKESAFDFGNGDFTIEAWTRLNALPTTNATIVSTSFVASPYFSIRFRVIDTGALYALLSTDGNFDATKSITSSITMAINNWYHVALVRSGANAILYIDGVNVGSLSTLSTGSIYYSTREPVQIGVDYSSSGSASTREYFNGHIQDLRITKGVARYTADFTPPTKLIGNISGTITDDAGSPAVRSIIAFPRVYPQRIATTTSAADGTYSLTNLPVTEHTAICLDDDAGNTYNALVLDRVIPV
jgi:hypothetical protein